MECMSQCHVTAICGDLRDQMLVDMLQPNQPRGFQKMQAGHDLRHAGAHADGIDAVEQHVVAQARRRRPVQRLKQSQGPVFAQSSIAGLACN